MNETLHMEKRSMPVCLTPDQIKKIENFGRRKGAHDQGGISVGIIPQNDSSYANEFCDIVIPSGMGFTRDFLTALSADGVIVIGGGAGTLSEICAAYMHKKPIVAIRNTSTTIEKFVDQYIDSRKHTKLVGVNSPKEAVKYILEHITS